MNNKAFKILCPNFEIRKSEGLSVPKFNFKPKAREILLLLIIIRLRIRFSFK